MNSSFPNPVLAIDGGGTRCRIALADGTTITSVETGSANVSSDFDGAVSEILKGLKLLATKAGLTQETIFNIPAYIGLAGVTGPSMADRLRHALPLKHARVEDDRRAALRGALGQQDGFVAHCGTGSFYAAQFGDRATFAGGWGPVLGDEASAQWVGRTALRMTLESTDGRRSTSAMAEYFLTDFESASGIVQFAADAGPSELGALAIKVTEMATKGDELAQDTMRAGATEIERSLMQMGWQPQLPICLTGGIGPEYRSYLPTEIERCVISPQSSPLEGALSLARAFAEKIA